MNQDNLYWVWLSLACGPASRSVPRLMERYEDPFDLYRLDEEELEQLDGIGASLKARLANKSLEASYAILRHCQEDSIRILTYADPRYPARLRGIVDPPLLLYYKGKLPDFNAKLCVGMVGTRKMSEYGKQIAYKISYELAAARAVVVSGMALGIDGVCACGALSAGGETVAVLGCGVNVIYPKTHKELMKQIQKHGVVISEYPPDERPFAANFPKRNRIISGLSQGVVVVEGAEGSGALITASQAVAQGREVFALPGQVGVSNSDGPNELIQNGAHVALSSRDILNFYDFLYHDEIRYKALDAAERKKPLCETVLEKYGVTERDEGRVLARTARDWTETAAAPDVPEQALDKDQKEEHAADHSAELLATLDANTKRVFEHMPLDRAISPDVLAAAGIPVGEALIALSVLELNGLVTSLPGGMYIRK